MIIESPKEMLLYWYRPYKSYCLAILPHLRNEQHSTAQHCKKRTVKISYLPTKKEHAFIKILFIRPLLELMRQTILKLILNSLRSSF